MELNTNLGRYILNPFKVLATTNVSITVAPASIDSQALAAGDRIFLSGQSTATQNGGWIFASAGTPLTRSTDLPVGATIKSGTVFMCNAGTVYGDKLIVIFASSDAPIIIGTTTFSISAVGDSYTFSTGLTDASGVITSDIITGKSGGQTAAGGTGPSENLIITSTIDGTKGFVTIGSTFFDEAGGYVGFGTASPGAKIEIVGDGSTSATHSIDIYDSSANRNFYVRDDGAVNSRLGYWIGANKFIHQGSVSSNFFGGHQAGASNVNCTQTTGVGNQSFLMLTTGQGGTALGHAAARDFVGTRITAIGLNACVGMTTPLGVTGVGDGTMNLFTTAGEYSTTLGFLALNGITTGNRLTVIGSRACSTDAGQADAGYSNSIAIGADVLITASNQLVIGIESANNYISDFAIGYGSTATSGFTGNTTIRPTNVAAGQSNQANNYELRFAGGKGTGTGVGSNIVWQVAPAGGSGNSQNAYVTKMTLKGSGIFNMALPTGNSGLVSGDLYKDTAANVLANGDYVVGMKA